jgi:hypothetical protein
MIEIGAVAFRCNDGAQRLLGSERHTQEKSLAREPPGVQ